MRRSLAPTTRHRRRADGVHQAGRAQAGHLARRRLNLGGDSAACRQHHGQSAGPGVQVAEAAGDRRVRTVDEIAEAEKINPSYVSRVLRLTLLAPDVVEAILDGRQPAEMTLAVLMRPFAVGWERQRAMGFGSGALRIE